MWSDAARQAAHIAEQAKAAAAAVGDHQNAQSAPVAPGRQPMTIHSEPSVGCPIIYDSGQFQRVAPDSGGGACEES